VKSAGAEWLSLAAAPVSAAMALAASLSGSGDALCTFARDTAPLGGMAPMYAMMAAFHLGPWLRLIPRHGEPHGEPKRA
jgi:hypothetical protein